MKQDKEVSKILSISRKIFFILFTATQVGLILYFGWPFFRDNNFQTIGGFLVILFIGFIITRWVDRKFLGGELMGYRQKKNKSQDPEK